MEQIRLQVNFMREQLLKGLHDIYEAQRMIATKRIYQRGSARIREYRPGPLMNSRSGELMKSLLSPQYTVSQNGGGIYGKMIYPLQIRFLDIKRLGNWQIYNRQIWGILYKKTFRDIRFEFSDWLKERTRKSLEEAMKQS